MTDGKIIEKAIINAYGKLTAIGIALWGVMVGVMWLWAKISTKD